MKKTCLLLALLLALFAAPLSRSFAQNQYVGEIKMFAGTFAPQGWMKCEGQLLSIAQYTPLFALLGTTYGGDGINTFALPDMRGRVPMGTGNGPGLTPTIPGMQQGSEQVTLVTANLPPHNHLINIYNGSGTLDSLSGSTSYLSLVQNADLSRANAFGTTAPNTTLNAATVSATGSGIPVPIKQPSLSVTFIISLQGIFPTP
ncbi:phage tail protein [Taibaiella chishuiensis]|uniref:Microcystin-dependent protein n=1 Tax=Taibaiella chishuiensis TaxID=1434707 RepID=A0A2P8CWX7_9BACT|nr:tail fiber protein [Taibaiella chishuiensis]PSK89478.1 microcystin-dependent protein [Taibaiella chishuiensis]